MADRHREGGRGEQGKEQSSRGSVTGVKGERGRAGDRKSILRYSGSAPDAVDKYFRLSGGSGDGYSKVGRDDRSSLRGAAGSKDDERL